MDQKCDKKLSSKIFKQKKTTALTSNHLSTDNVSKDCLSSNKISCYEKKYDEELFNFCSNNKKDNEIVTNSIPSNQLTKVLI